MHSQKRARPECLLTNVRMHASFAQYRCPLAEVLPDPSWRDSKGVTGGGNALRAAALGASDGLTTNLSLVMGVAGANLPGHTILFTGLAGMNQSTRQLLLKRLEDERSKRVIFVSHCLLNENTRYLGGAFRRGCVDELVDGFQQEGLGIYQMRCPEQRAWGGVLKRHLLPIYGSTRISTVLSPSNSSSCRGC